MSDSVIQIVVLILISIAVTVTSVRRTPGIGIILAVAVIGMAVWIGPLESEDLGLTRPSGPLLRTVGLGLLLGGLSAFASLILLEPGIERLTGRPHDLGIVDSVRGNLAVLIQWVIVVWLTVAIVEEFIFRGFIMSALVDLIGRTPLGLTVALLASSLLFGIGHAYQGWSGTLSTGLIGLFMGVVFIAADFNLLLPILVHGFFDTVQLVLIWRNLDSDLRKSLFRSAH